ncbi:MAG: hypothetical protein J5789_07055 [Oscillospiraceae bacterium]|nr:hypothetical protein [Oscillospiraceae bacterium]
MKQIYKELLFEKNYLVSDGEGSTDNCFEVIFTFAALYNIRIVSGEKLAQKDMIPFIAEQLGIKVPETFYRGFPASVKTLSSDEMLFDQLYHYTKTYGLNLFEETGHALLESFLDKTAFRDKIKIKEFTIISEKEAKTKIADVYGELLQSSRTLGDKQYNLVLEYLKDYDVEIKTCGSKSTAIRLLADSRNLNLTQFINMQDVIKLVEEINYRLYGSDDIKKLNMRNPDKKFITDVIDKLIEGSKCDIESYCERRAIWIDLLRQLSYRGTDDLLARFVACWDCQRRGML